MTNRVPLCRLFIAAAVVLLGVTPVSAEITATRIVKDETISIGGTAVRHVAGTVLGRAEHDEPGIPTLDKVVGLKYEADFELWLPADRGNGQKGNGQKGNGQKGNGRFWFSVLNRGNDLGGLRDGILRRGGAYGWCAWQAKNVAPPGPQLKLTGFTGPMPQAYGLVVVRDFVAFLRRPRWVHGARPGSETTPNPAAGQVKFVFAYGISQSGRFMRTFLLHGLNKLPGGKVFDGFVPDGARAGYVDLFRPNSDAGSGGTFSAETVYAPYSWPELMARSGSDAKVLVLNAESEYYEMMAYMARGGPLPDNVRVYDFSLGGHGGGGTVPWHISVQPLSVALEEWVVHGTKPPDSRMFALEKRESPRARNLPSLPARLPIEDELGIARGGVRLPPVEAPIVRYVCDDGKAPRAVPLNKAALARRYGTPENYRRKVSATVDRLIRDRFLPESARAKYAADAEKVNW